MEDWTMAHRSSTHGGSEDDRSKPQGTWRSTESHPGDGVAETTIAGDTEQPADFDTVATGLKRRAYPGGAGGYESHRLRGSRWVMQPAAIGSHNEYN